MSELSETAYMDNDSTRGWMSVWLENVWQQKQGFNEIIRELFVKFWSADKVLKALLIWR